MIIENIQKSDVQTIGDIKQIKASIDIENIEFIATLLSSNLYSQPIKSFLREIVSNAWDSHVEKGNTEDPVIINVLKDNVSIRDYGTGLSQEDFENLYCKIGSSTKRESNAYIGSFGIGHLSSLAVSDVVYITNYYNGYAHKYVMIKENGIITTNELSNTPTGEKNGLLISVPIKVSQIDEIKDAIKSLVFFPNIYVNYEGISVVDSENVNKATVVRYKNFSVTDVIGYPKGYNWQRIKKCWVLLGNVLYPLDIDKLTCFIDNDTLDNLKDINVCLNVNIGDINITPNRESIIYSESTVKLLSDKMEAAINEINTIISQKSKNFDNICDYYCYLDNTGWDSIRNDVCIYMRNMGIWKCSVGVSYKGIKRDEDFNKAVKLISKKRVPGLKNVYSRNKCYTIKGMPYSTKYKSSVIGAAFVAIEGNRNLSGYTKQYIADHSEYHGIPIINQYSKEVFIKELLDGTVYINSISGIINADAKEIAEDYYDIVHMKTKIIRLHDINAYKELLKSTLVKNTSTRDTSKYVLHKMTAISSYGGCEDKIITNPILFSEIIDNLKGRGKCILHNGKDITATQADDYKALIGLGYTIIWCSNKLYNNIVKYISTRKNPKILNNIVLNPKAVLDNINKQVECTAIMCKVFTTILNYGYTAYDEKLFSVIDYIKDILPVNEEFKTLYDEHKYKRENLRELSSTLYYTKFKDYEYKTATGIELNNYLNKIIKIVDKYQEYIIALRKTGLSYNYLLVNVGKFLTIKWMIKNKIPFNYSSYNKVKNSDIIKILYKNI